MDKGNNPQLALDLIKAINDETLEVKFDWRDWIYGWTSKDQTIVSEGQQYQLSLVHQEGGDEGGGEYVERVISVKGITGELFGYVMINGYYMSYDGITWDDSDEFLIVEPKEVTVIQYFKV